MFLNSIKQQKEGFWGFLRVSFFTNNRNSNNLFWETELSLKIKLCRIRQIHCVCDLLFQMSQSGVRNPSVVCSSLVLPCLSWWWFFCASFSGEILSGKHSKTIFAKSDLNHYLHKVYIWLSDAWNFNNWYQQSSSSLCCLAHHSIFVSCSCRKILASDRSVLAWHLHVNCLSQSIWFLSEHVLDKFAKREKRHPSKCCQQCFGCQVMPFSLGTWSTSMLTECFNDLEENPMVSICKRRDCLGFPESFLLACCLLCHVKKDSICNISQQDPLPWRPGSRSIDMCSMYIFLALYTL